MYLFLNKCMYIHIYLFFYLSIYLCTLPGTIVTAGCHRLQCLDLIGISGSEALHAPEKFTQVACLALKGLHNG